MTAQPDQATFGQQATEWLTNTFKVRKVVTNLRDPTNMSAETLLGSLRISVHHFTCPGYPSYYVHVSDTGRNMIDMKFEGSTLTSASANAAGTLRAIPDKISS